jgi:hypothetical protein
MSESDASHHSSPRGGGTVPMMMSKRATGTVQNLGSLPSISKSISPCCFMVMPSSGPPKFSTCSTFSQCALSGDSWEPSYLVPAIRIVDTIQHISSQVRFGNRITPAARPALPSVGQCDALRRTYLQIFPSPNITNGHP